MKWGRSSLKRKCTITIRQDTHHSNCGHMWTSTSVTDGPIFGSNEICVIYPLFVLIDAQDAQNVSTSVSGSENFHEKIPQSSRQPEPAVCTWPESPHTQKKGESRNVSVKNRQPKVGPSPRDNPPTFANRKGQLSALLITMRALRDS